VGASQESTCDFLCEDDLIPVGELRCVGGNWLVTGGCFPEDANLTIRRAVQQVFLIAGADDAWGQEQGKLLAAAGVAALQKRSADLLRLEVLPSQGGRRLESSEIETFRLRVTAMTKDDFESLDAVEALFDKDFASGFSGAQANVTAEPHSVAMQVQQYYAVLPAWQVQEWQGCESSDCSAKDVREVTCSIFGHLACEADASLLKPLTERSCGGCQVIVTVVDSSTNVGVFGAAAGGAFLCLCCSFSVFWVYPAKAQGRMRLRSTGLHADYRVNKAGEVEEGTLLEEGRPRRKTHVVWDLQKDQVDKFFAAQGTALRMGAKSSSRSEGDSQGSGSGMLRRQKATELTPRAMLSRCIVDSVLDLKDLNRKGYKKHLEDDAVLGTTEPVPVPASTLAFEDGVRVEYFSQTTRRWVAGIACVTIGNRSNGRTSKPFARYGVTLLHSGQHRPALQLDSLRATLEDGEPLEVWSGGQWFPAICLQPGPSATTLGYSVMIVETGEQLSSVLPDRLRRRFEPGTSAQVYRGLERGWVDVLVCEDFEADSEMPAAPSSPMSMSLHQQQPRVSLNLSLNSLESTRSCKSKLPESPTSPQSPTYPRLMGGSAPICAKVSNAMSDDLEDMPPVISRVSSAGSVGVAREAWKWTVIRECTSELLDAPPSLGVGAAEWCPSYLLRQGTACAQV